ncbi:PKD-like family lipoprotein [Chitinophaga sp. sic0106]|uniref:PKD-like family lipoprotein n=1 Tax=Chitinophaga sp. sic0106 TaxID=2854785 RepID=UPI001C47CEBC|nr:PKD-like family lipoprotein [Chitinophaga sp. sic0106]MBV7529175.1 hypothetical protein [Chitinophaga sp. sic0106]
MRISYILTAAILFLLFTGCYKDLGNYDYVAINSAEIKGIKDTVVVMNGDSAFISPEITFTKGGGENDYTYKWILVGNAGASSNRVLSEKRNLAALIPVTLGTYDMFFQVRETATGILWQKQFKLAVVGAIKPQGWFVMSEVNGATRLDYYQEDAASLGTYLQVYRDFSQRLVDPTDGTQLRFAGKPKFMSIWANTVTPAEARAKTWLYVGTSEGIEKVNITDGFIWKKTKYNFEMEAISKMCQRPDWVRGQNTGVGYAYQDKKLFKNNAVGYQWFDVPINQINGLVFDVSPVIATVYNQIFMQCLMFDVTKKRLLMHYGENSNTVKALGAGNGSFKPDSLGMDVVWLGYTPVQGGLGLGVFDDGKGKRFLARLTWKYINGIAEPFAMDDITSLTDITKADFYAVDERYGYLFYSAGNKVYRYNTDTKELIVFREYPSNFKISMMKARTNPQINAWIYVSVNPNPAVTRQLEPGLIGLQVGVYDPSMPDVSGKVDVLKITPDPTPATLYYTLSGLGKVVAADYLYQ